MPYYLQNYSDDKINGYADRKRPLTDYFILYNFLYGKPFGVKKTIFIGAGIGINRTKCARILK